jgi:hypothetical protein
MFYNELLIDLSPDEQELLSGGKSTPTSGSPNGEGSSPNGESEKEKEQFTFIPMIVLLPVATINALANSQKSKKEN